MPVLVVRAPHRRADARRDLVADDHRAQELRAVAPVRLRERQRRRDGRRARVVDAVAVDVVHLDGVRRGAVDQRGRARRRRTSEREACGAVVQIVRQRAFESRRLNCCRINKFCRPFSSRFSFTSTKPTAAKIK